MASSIVTSAARQLGTLLAEEAKYLYAVSDKIKNLKSELEWMQCFLQDVDIREHQEKVARKWVAEIREFAYEAEDLIERYVCKVSHHRRKGVWNTVKWFSCICGDALTLHDIGSSMDELSERISKMASRLQMYGVHISSKQPESLSWDYRIARKTSYSDGENIVGLENDMRELVEKLLREETVRVLEIFGSPGSGKTTLARKLYSHKDVQRRFKKCVWVCVFEKQDSFVSKNVFEEILVGLGNGAREDTKGLSYLDLNTRIRNGLEREDCLVILDDVATKDWYTKAPAFGSLKRGGSKIVVTTDVSREEDGYFSDEISEGYSHRMKPLSLEDSWLLLRRTMLVQSGQGVARMEKFGKQMLRRYCNNHPMSIVALGGILATKNTEDWEDVNKTLSSRIKLSDETDKLAEIMELSYSNLPYYLKSCFMYLGMFPKGSEIQVDRLCHLWEVEGFISTSEEDESRDIHDDIAESYLNQLVRTCLVEADKRWPDGRLKSCRLRRETRDLCIAKCKEVNFVDIVEGGTSKARLKSRRRVIHWVDEIDPFRAGLNEGPYLRSLSVFSNEPQMVEKLLSRKMKDFLSLLRVLDLEGTAFTPQRLDIRVLRYCIHLRYLSLRGSWSAENTVPRIWECIFLETLDLRLDCKSHKHPILMINKICKLGRLRHLYLPDDFVLSNKQQLSFSPAQLSQIETLVNFNAKQCRVSDLNEMTNLRTFSFNTPIIDEDAVLVHLVESPALKTGNLRCNPFKLRVMASAINENPEILTSLELLRACIDDVSISGAIGKEAFLNYGDSRRIFPYRLRRLCLDGCEIPEEGIVWLERLPDLKELKLSNRAVSGIVMSFSKGSFPQLVKLTLKNVCYLEEWEVGEDALPKLVYLEIIDCNELKMIPQNLPESLAILCHPREINGSEKYRPLRLVDINGNEIVP